ncbi:MAG: TetR/AcrR family transcriptional regulator [Betaproteobacteria bacterium]|nr:TetR/AcrR family transcriptional regulator [Betaproteobacteria bacterium]
MPPSKGEQTRATILDAGLALASKLGLEGLTIGTLADATGLSKSGLFAHFGSREDLQLAVLEHAAQRYVQRVFMPAVTIPRGLPRLRALFERWLEWSVESGLPGGCIMISAAAEYDDRPGPIRDAVIAYQRQGSAVSEKAVRLAVEEGHLRPDTDPEQIAFELLGIILANHNHRRLLGDKEARKRALTAFDELVARHAPALAAKKPRLRAVKR